MCCLDGRYRRRADVVIAIREPQGAVVQQLREQDHRRRKLIMENEGTARLCTHTGLLKSSKRHKIARHGQNLEESWPAVGLG
jgi:hypothetical protein